MKILFALAAAAVLTTTAGQAGAADGHWKFELHNDSRAKVLSFKTKEEGKWSDNWLEESVDPGETYDMDFNSDTGDCTVKTRIDFSDDTYVSADIDYCNSKQIFVHGDGITWK